MNIVILAGGRGSRLWPVSRTNNPKQISEIFSAHEKNTKTMLERAYALLRKKFSARNIFICADKKSAQFITKHLRGLPKENIFIEPKSAGTAAACFYAATNIYRMRGNAPLVFVSSDANIEDKTKYLKTIEDIETVLKSNPNKTVLVGIKPRYPETGYGYIKVKSSRSIPSAWVLRDKRQSKIKNKVSTFKVEKFIEKPSLEKAKQFIKSGQYFWNPGIFGWNAGHLINLFKNHLPDTYRALSKLSINKLNSKQVSSAFQKFKPTTIDYGILEKEKDILVIPADFGWIDIGNWKTVYELLLETGSSNVIEGKYLGIGSAGNLVYAPSGRLIATIDLKNTALIETPDVLLICPLDKAQEVKKITEVLKNKKLQKYL